MATRRAAYKALGGSVVRALVVGLLETSLALLFALINPFHIDEWAFERNQGVWQRIMADGYECQRSHLDWANRYPCDVLERPQWPKPRPDQKDTRELPRAKWRGPNPPPITVFYLDEKSLRDGAPPPTKADRDAPLFYTLALSEHQDLLEDIAAAKTLNAPAPKPAAIFIDILFDETASAGPLAETLMTSLETSEAAGPEAMQAVIKTKLNECARPPAKDAVVDHFGCYVAHVATITNFPRWGSKDCGRSSLAKLACILHYGGTPVVFADARRLSPRTPVVPLTLSMQILDKVAITAPAMIEGKGYPLVPEGSDNRPLDGVALTEVTYALPPASLLYAAYCLEAEAVTLQGSNADRSFERCPVLPVVASLDSHDSDSNLLRGRNISMPAGSSEANQARSATEWARIQPVLHWAANFEKRLDLLWGVGDDQREIHGSGTFAGLLDRLHGDNLHGSNGSTLDTDRCRSAQPNLWRRAIRVMREATPTFAGRKDDKPCRYVPSLPVGDLDGAITDNDKRLLLDGKVVMIGGQYLRSGDWIPALETAVPGVQYHAMALANLMDLNHDYRPVEQPVISGSSFVLASWPTFLAVFAINVAVALAIMTLNDPKFDPDRPQASVSTRTTRRRARTMWWIRIALVSFPGLLLIVAFTFFMTSIHHLNLTVILALIAAATVKLLFVLIRPLLEEGVAFFEWFDITDRALFASKPRSIKASEGVNSSVSLASRGEK